MVESGSLSELLASWQAGDQQTLESLLPVAYHELRRLAHRYLRKRPGHTLQSAAPWSHTVFPYRHERAFDLHLGFQ